MEEEVGFTESVQRTNKVFLLIILLCIIKHKHTHTHFQGDPRFQREVEVVAKETQDRDERNREKKSGNRGNIKT